MARTSKSSSSSKKSAAKRPPKKSTRRSQKRPAKGPVGGSKARTPRKAKAVGTLRSRAGRALRRLLLLCFLVLAAAAALVVALEWERVGDRMDGRVHDEPARITGVIPRLEPGGPATAAGWTRTLADLGYRSVEAGSVRRPGEFAVAGARWTIFPTDGPMVQVVVKDRRVRSLTRADDGSSLPALDLPLPALSLLTDSARERRSVVPLADIPQTLQREVVAIEDERFHKHLGVDPRGLLRATVQNLRAGGVTQGGSTITQQLAKNMFLSADRTMLRKAREAVIAGVLEARYDKERILEAYLNEIYLGQRGGYAILGVSEAARAWFGKDLSTLTLAESALLAGAIRSPNRLVPWKHPEAARERRDLVLDKMLHLEAASPEAVAAARATPVTVGPARAVARTAPWFVDRVVGTLGDRYTPEALHRDGLELVTTIDPRLQAIAEEAVRDWRSSLKGRAASLFDGPGPEVALLALDPRDGAVRALVGGVDYGRSQFDRATDARRQPGSAMKPIVLAAAIEARWPRLGPGSLVLDAPLTVAGAGPGGRDWKPGNWDDQFRGPMTLQRATELSRNPPFVRLGMNTGLDRVVETAHAMGITTPLRAIPSLSIGAQEVTPTELAVAYAALANGGRRVEPRVLEGVRDRDGGWLERAASGSDIGIDPRAAAAVTRILEGVVERGTGKQVREAGFTLPVAAKTGTSNESRDGWMVGYTPDLVTVVWVGFDQERSLGLSSTRSAAPLWTDFMVEAQPFLSGEAFDRPAGLASLLDEELEPGAGTGIAPVPAPSDPLAPTPEDTLRDEDAARRAAERAAMREMR